MEFKEFCENFNRMARECTEKNPFESAANSKYAEDWLVWATGNVEEAEDYVATWTREHPAPIYPTFGEYLRDMANHDKIFSKVPLNELLNTPMSEKVAEQYNVTPLNLCGIKKYASDWL